MNNLLIFAGTTEGRELAEFLDRQGVSCDVCVATEYGEQLLDGHTTGHRVHRGRLTQEEMEAADQAGGGLYSPLCSFGFGEYPKCL